MTAASFKRAIRDLQVWCSSCMVAFARGEPIGVLIGAKRPAGTLVHRIAVHPDHRRQGHGRHLLESLGSKLAILGPPRIVAEVPETIVAGCQLFAATGYVQETLLTDYVLERPRQSLGEPAGGYVIPVTVEDLAANGLIGKADPPTCWERSVESLMARQDQIAGLAVASDEQIEASVLYIEDGPSREIALLRSFIGGDGGARLGRLISALGPGTLRFPKVHPAEISAEVLTELGFRPEGKHPLYAGTARAV
jgi:hypothetical protein